MIILLEKNKYYIGKYNGNIFKITDLQEFIFDIINYRHHFSINNLYDSCKYLYDTYYLQEYKYHDSYFKITLNVNSVNHCGYCSDNENDSTHTSSFKDIYYLAIPPLFINNVGHDELQSLNDLELDTGSRCYCGKSYNDYSIDNVEIINKK